MKKNHIAGFRKVSFIDNWGHFSGVNERNENQSYIETAKFYIFFCFKIAIIPECQPS